jgi:Ca2+:H+ antiporter
MGVVTRTPWWTWTWPVFAWVILLMTSLLGSEGIIAAVAGVALLATLFMAVYHAEVVAPASASHLARLSSPWP